MFYLDDRFHTVTNVAPYRCQWNASYYSPGPHHIKAVALDVDNNVAAERTVSAVVVAH